MLTEDDIANRLRVEDGTVSILSSDEAHEIAGTFDELRKSRDEWRELCDGERSRADANLELAHGFDEEARALRALLREARDRMASDGWLPADPLLASIDAALKGGEDE